MSKIKNGGLDQYGAEPFEQQQFGTAGVEGVNESLYWAIESSTMHVCYGYCRHLTKHENASCSRPITAAALSPTAEPTWVERQ